MIIAVLLTIILECCVLLALREREKLFYLYWIGVTSLTNLSINIILSIADPNLYWTLVLILEILVFISEALLCYLYKRSFVVSIKYSAICNIVSFLTGILIMPFYPA